MLNRWLCSLGLALCQALLVMPAAAAAPMPVHVDAQFQFEFGGAPFPGTGLAIDFEAPDFGDPATFVEGSTAWGFRGLDALLTIGGTPRDDTLAQVAWFAYGDGYAGIDLRFTDVYAPGDWLQVVLVTRAPLFDGPVDAPVLRAVVRQGLGGFVGYQNEDGDYVDGSLFGGHYVAGVVPEPGIAWMMAAGLGLLAARGRRRTR